MERESLREREREIEREIVANNKDRERERTPCNKESETKIDKKTEKEIGVGLHDNWAKIYKIENLYAHTVSFCY